MSCHTKGIPELDGEVWDGLSAAGKLGKCIVTAVRVQNIVDVLLDYGRISTDPFARWQ